RPSGDTATLPDTETETAALTEAPVDAPIADNKAASVATTELDTEPAAHVIAEADEATSEAEETPDATAEEATWHPNAPTLGSRAELEPGTYLTARTGPLTEHQATFEDLTAAGHETAFLRAGDQ